MIILAFLSRFITFGIHGLLVPGNASESLTDSHMNPSESVSGISQNGDIDPLFIFFAVHYWDLSSYPTVSISLKFRCHSRISLTFNFLQNLNRIIPKGFIISSSLFIGNFWKYNLDFNGILYSLECLSIKYNTRGRSGSRGKLSRTI